MKRVSATLRTYALQRLVRRVLVGCTVMLAPATSGSDWLHPRGPNLDGRANQELGSSTPDAAVWQLNQAWTADIGPGYTSVVVADGIAVTSFSHDDADWTAAFRVDDGTAVWRQRLGPRYPAHDGSEDGPSSSPVVGHGMVYTLHPLGDLMALRLADGSVAWRRHVARELGGVPSSFGFTVTPVVVGDVLVLPIGHPEHAIVGLDAHTGVVRWTGGDGAVLHQSPLATPLAGRVQVVTVTSTALLGLAPDDGRLLWRHPLVDEDRGHPTTVVTPFETDRLLVRQMETNVAFHVTPDGDGYRVAELYRTNAFGRSLSPPVYHQGHFYGFRGGILVCARADTGERVWRSRAPGGDGLVLIGDTLAIFAARGFVVLADASPDGYQERARLPVLDASGLAWPTLAGNRLLVRNARQVAAIDLDIGTPEPTAPIRPDDTLAHDFARWLQTTATSERPQVEVDRWWRTHPEMPVVEERYLHFAVRADATDVAIQGSLLDDEAIAPLTQLERTDFFYRTFERTPGARWEYRYQVDFETWMLDPRNPRIVPDIAGTGVYSEVTTPGYRAAPHLEPPQGPRGRIEIVKVPDRAPSAMREVAIWLPPGYDDRVHDETRYPLLLVQDGKAWLDHGKLSIALDNLVGRTVAPAVVAFLNPAPAWWSEAGGSGTERYAPWVADTLVPALAQRYRLHRDPGAHAIWGHRYHGFGALDVALRHPDLFGAAAAISPGLGLGHDDALAALIASGAGRSVRIYLDWNRYGLRRLDRGYDFTRFGETLAHQLAAAGYTVEGGERLDSAGWGGWRNRADQVLESILPLPPTRPTEP